MNDGSSHLLSGNRLLEALPEAELTMLRPHFEQAMLTLGTVIANPGDHVKQCFFPTKGMISLLSVTEQGETIEAAYVGREGMAGLAWILGGQDALYQWRVQAETECLLINGDIVRRLFDKLPAFRSLSLRYVYALLRQMSQTCLCNHFHTIESRLCRWLTVMCERSGNNRLSLTQEFLSQMLGVQRTSIGLIANSMQTKGIIRYSRGKIEVTNLERLRDNACECYRIVNAEYASLYKTAGRPKR